MSIKFKRKLILISCLVVPLNFGSAFAGSINVSSTYSYLDHTGTNSNNLQVGEFIVIGAGSVTDTDSAQTISGGTATLGANSGPLRSNPVTISPNQFSRSFAYDSNLLNIHGSL